MVFFYLFIILAFEFILTVSACFFFSFLTWGYAFRFCFVHLFIYRTGAYSEFVFSGISVYSDSFLYAFFLSIFSSFIQGGFGSFSSESGPHWESRLLILFIIYIYSLKFLFFQSLPFIHPHVKIPV